MPTFRIIRSANAHFYMAATIIVLGAAAYVFICKDILWQQIAAALAAIITPIWASYYLILRFIVTEKGITRRTLLGTTTLTWAELTSAELLETSNQGTASCTICLKAGNRKMNISSDLLPLESVQELAAELQTCRILPAPVTTP